MKFINKIFVIALVIITIISCESEDIKPVIEISSSSMNLSEDLGTVEITANLNSIANNDIYVNFNTTGTADLNEDYTISSNQILITENNSYGSVIITAIDDEIIEEIETIVLNIYSEDVLVFSSAGIEISILDDDTDTDSDGVPDNEDNCPEVPGEVSNNGCPWLGFLLNEVHYDPATPITGDANGDGIREAQGDEFIELFNSAENSLDLSGYTVSDASAVRHTFPTGTIIPSNGVLVLFGGGTPTGDFGGALVQTANGLDNRLNLNNGGDSVIINDQEGDVIISYNSADTGVNHGANQSVTRSPDLSGNFVLHTEANSNGALFSPGTRTDGSSF